MDVHGHGRIQGVRIKSQATRHLDGDSSKCFLKARDMSSELGFFFFFFPSNKELSKTSPSEQEHIHCKQGKRTNSGDLTYVMIFNASKGWNAFTPECCFKFDLLLLCSSCHPPVFNIIPPVGHGKTL